MKLQNPHDRVFKEVFSDISITKDFIQSYLPKEMVKLLDLDSIQLQKDSYVDEKLKKSFSDLVFQIQTKESVGYISILFEHKSYPTEEISLQLLPYICNIWEEKYKKEKVKKLPLILPIVIYHGTKSWETEQSLAEILGGYNKLPVEYQAYIPNFKYLLYDLTRYSDGDLKGNEQLRFFFRVLKTIQSLSAEDFLQNFLNQIAQLYHLENQVFVPFINTILFYISTTKQNLNKQHYEQMIQIIEQNYPKGDEQIMTWAELFREEGIQEGLQRGLQKGIQEGLQKGVQEGKSEVLINLLTKRFGILPQEMRKNIQSLDIYRIDIITNEIFHFETLDDVQKYLK